MADSNYGGTPTGPGSSYRFATHRGTASSKRTSYYPNPFFDIAQTYMPSTTKQLFRWCRYYAVTNPLIATVIHKMSAYPITEVIYETDNPGLQTKWRDLFEDQWKIRSFVIESNLDRNTYGNSFISVSFPFIKMLKCRQCSAEWPIHRHPYKWRDFDFWITCKECNHQGKAKVRDFYTKSPRGIRLVRWNPESIDIRFNEVTGEKSFFYRIPKSLRNDIIIGRAETIEKIPKVFVEALRHQKSVIIRSDHLFHSYRPSVSRSDAGWGTPMLMPVLKDVFYLQVLKKAQEAIFFGYITPMRIIYPAPQSGAGGQPFQSVNLGKWRDRVADEIQEHRRDPNYMPLMPIPIGYQNIGGEGKALMLSNEIRVWSEHIVAGMGVPPELVFSGVSWSGSNVSLRMLENEFIGNREDNLALLRFIQDSVASHLGWPKVGLRFKPFKMADDLQRAAFDFQLAQAKLLSKQTLLESRDYDYQQEIKRVKDELSQEAEITDITNKASAETQGKMSVIQAKYQVEANEILQAAQPQQDPNAQPPTEDPNAQPQQQAPNAQPQTQPAMGEGGIVGKVESNLNQRNMANAAAGRGDPEASAAQHASQISSMDQFAKGQALSALKVSAPDVYARVLQLLNPVEGGAPMPMQRAPTRNPGTAQI